MCLFYFRIQNIGNCVKKIVIYLKILTVSTIFHGSVLSIYSEIYTQHIKRGTCGNNLMLEFLFAIVTYWYVNILHHDSTVIFVGIRCWWAAAVFKCIWSLNQPNIKQIFLILNWHQNQNKVSSVSCVYSVHSYSVASFQLHTHTRHIHSLNAYCALRMLIIHLCVFFCTVEVLFNLWYGNI